jgi:hypothetical protein
MDERLQFVARRLAGEPMAELCRQLGISRKTGTSLCALSAFLRWAYSPNWVQTRRLSSGCESGCEICQHENNRKMPATIGARIRTA